MLNIAIVDDLDIDCEALHNLLEEYENFRHQRIRIEEFHSGRDFLSNYRTGAYNVIFMDIFLNAENGVDCALELRKCDPDVSIIFLTTSPDFGVKSYDVRASDYIVKPATMEKLERALHYCKVNEPQDKPFITVCTRNKPLKVDLGRILYADFQNRSACIHLTDCCIPVSGSFTELSSQLTKYPQFMSCFKGIVVNLRKVSDISGDQLSLKNGERLPVSRRLQRQVQQRRLSLSAGSLRGELT